jgi:SsrA-binding protein
MKRSEPKPGPSIRNRKAHFRFEILEKIECGVVLQGTEVKSLRAGQVSLEEAYARIQDDEIWLIGAHIAPYEHGNVMNHEPTRPRKLLLHRREIRKLLPKVTQRGLTMVPLAMYFNQRGLAKCTLGLARGKTHDDKRQDIREREQKREMDQARRGGGH